MSASTNRAIQSSGNTGTVILKYLPAPVELNNGFAVTNIFAFKATQLGTQYQQVSIDLRAGDDTTVVNRFRIQVYHENSGFTDQDFITTPTTLPLYNGNTSTQLVFQIINITNVTADATDAFEVNVFVDYEGNTEPLVVGGTFQLTKLV
jgi:hypothetical protein